MYTINLSFDKTIKAYSRESKLYKYSKKDIKNITVGDMITKSLNSSFKIINPSLCNDSKKELDYLVNLINNQKLQFNMLLLDLRGLWLTFDKAFQKNKAEKSKVHINNIGQYIDACKNNNLYTGKKENLDLNLVNICLVFKLSQPIHKDLNGLNTIAIFCDLNIQKKIENQNDIVSDLIIKRIELLELNNEISSSSTWINIVINDNNANFYYDPSFYVDLCNLSPIISFDKKSSDLRKYLRYDDWTKFIFAIRDYYKAKKEEISENNQILYFLGEDTTYNSNDDVECYLLQKKGSSANINKSEKSKYFLINRDDEADKYKISLNDLEFDASNTLIKKLREEVKLLDENILNFKKDNVTLEKTINNLKLKKQDSQKDWESKSTKLDEIKEELNKNNIELNNLSSSLNDSNKRLQVLNQEQKTLTKDKTLKDDETTNKNETLLNQIKKTKEEIEKLNADINNLDNSIKELEKQENIQKQEIKNVEKDLKNWEDSIKKNKQKVSSNDQEISNDNSKLEKYNNQIEILNQGEYNVSKISFAFSDEDNFNPLILKDSALSDNYKTANNFYINQEDTGTLAILNRYADGLEQIKSGYYKNPYLFANLIQPDNLRVQITKEIDKTILNNYQLNQNQEDAVRKAINIDNFFYLQGPPGTGKTQTICAIANQYAIENKTILMTSQSHEAINNFFDRLDELNRNNPLLIMIKYIANEEMNESNKYNIDYAWKRFVIKCINACNPLDSEKDMYLQVIQELETNNFKIPAFMTSSEEEIVINDRSLLNNLNSMNRFDDDSKIQEIIKYSSEYENNFDFKKLIEAFSTRAKNKDTNNKNLLDKYDNLINELNKWTKLTKLFDNLQEIKDYLNKNNKNSKYVSLFKKCYLNNKKDLKNSSKFKDYIVKNHLINIFGITTTSKITLSLLKNNDTDLFYDWPIDIVIIDEISKSTTPEILSRIVLAKKVIFAGDYKQLPPKSDFNEDECEVLIQNKKFCDAFNNKKFVGSELLDLDYDETDTGDAKTKKVHALVDWLKKLYKDSFFNKEVQDLRNKVDRDTTPYQNLTIQHRFCEDIMNVVNTFYENDEKLQMPKESRNFPSYKFNLTSERNGSEQTYDERVILIDSSYLSNNIYDYFKNQCQIKINQNDSFDTRNGNKKSSAVNPYNCIIITTIIDELIRDNKPNLKPSDIGIITMTKTQKSLIQSKLARINQDYKNIKIDTVDNFQGREAEVIIVDFVRSYGKLEGDKVKLEARNLDFYFVKERINVAISRAKAKLIIVGSFKNHYLKKDTIKRASLISKEREALENIYNSITLILEAGDYIWTNK